MAEQLVERIQDALTQSGHHVSFAITLMEHLVVPTFVLDAEQRVLIWNKACERLTDLPAAEVVGTRNHWQAFYEQPRPCLADLVATGEYQQIADLYTVHEEPGEPVYGVHAENWCWMPRRHQRLYLAVDAGPVFDEAGQLIAVVETLRDITEKQIAQTKVIEQAGILKAHYDEHQRESELARRILEHQIRHDQMAQARVSYQIWPASHFSGDMVLAACAPSGRRYAMLADATGHGLAAAVSILPIVQEFYRLVELDQPLSSLIESINFLLGNSLPLGRFVAAAFVCIDESAQQGEVWIGGVPDVLMLDVDGGVRRRFASNNLPMGIVREVAGTGVERFNWDQPCRLVMLSDGVLEMSGPGDEQFGSERLVAALAEAPSTDLVSHLHSVLLAHAAGEAAHDDMSILVVDCRIADRQA